MMIKAVDKTVHVNSYLRGFFFLKRSALKLQKAGGLPPVPKCGSRIKLKWLNPRCNL